MKRDELTEAITMDTGRVSQIADTFSGMLAVALDKGGYTANELVAGGLLALGAFMHCCEI